MATFNVKVFESVTGLTTNEGGTCLWLNERPVVGMTISVIWAPTQDDACARRTLQIVAVVYPTFSMGSTPTLSDQAPRVLVREVSIEGVL